jgi:hypothetical protein
MAVYRLARREPPKCANAALQSLARRTTLPCGPHLALVHLGGSEICIIKVEGVLVPLPGARTKDIATCVRFNLVSDWAEIFEFPDSLLVIHSTPSFLRR